MSKGTAHAKRNFVIAIACIVLVLFTYFVANDYLNREIYSRDREITDLKNQVSTMQEFLLVNGSMITNLTDTVDRLTYENEQLTNLTNTKQYQLMLAWHEIYELRNQTARLERQITELQAAPTP